MAKQSSKQISSRAISMAVFAVIGTIILIMFPVLVSGVWKMVGWVLVGAGALSSGMFYHFDKVKQIEADKELEKQRLKRNKRRRQEKEQQEKKLEAKSENLKKQEDRQALRREKIKNNIIEEATIEWTDRVDFAKAQEQAVRQVIEKTDHMPIRVSAGEVAMEWHEATSVAQWTMQQIDMFARQPDAVIEAREEAREATIEAIRVRESGGLWTAEQGKKLAEKKEKAKVELQTEEKRIDDMRDKLVDAKLKWNSAERRIERLTEELKKHTENYERLKKR
jgi:hypothetical protein